MSVTLVLFHICPDCGGGDDIPMKCLKCNGEGTIKQTIEVEGYLEIIPEPKDTKDYK